MAENKRIPELTYRGLVPSNGKFVFYDPATDLTYHCNASDIFSDTANPDDAWNPETEYAEGTVVSYLGEVWVATAEPDNIGQPPGPDSDFWEIGVKPEFTYKVWGGDWTFPGGAMPNAVRGGVEYFTSTGRGVPDDANYIAPNSLLTSKAAGNAEANFIVK